MSHVKIADALGVNNDIEIYTDDKKINVISANTGAQEFDDYTLNRNTLRSLVEVGANSLTELLTVAKSSQKARDYEVAAKLMDSITNITKNIKDLHKKDTSTRIGNLENEQRGDTINVEKAVFVGTTAQLLKEIKKENMKIIEGE